MLVIAHMTMSGKTSKELKETKGERAGNSQGKKENQDMRGELPQNQVTLQHRTRRCLRPGSLLFQKNNHKLNSSCKFQISL